MTLNLSYLPTIDPPIALQSTEISLDGPAIDEGPSQILTSLARAREEWETAELARSNGRLYELLAACYRFYLTMKNGPSEGVRSEYRKALDVHIERRGYIFIRKSHDLNRIVKSVFGGVDRRRVSAYSMALRVALKSDKGQPIAADQLADWFKDAGGVEEVRQGAKSGGLTGKLRADSVRKRLEGVCLQRVSLNARDIPMSADDADKQVLLYGVYRSTGDVEIRAVVKNDTAIRAALAAAYADQRVTRKAKTPKRGKRRAATIANLDAA